MLKTNHIPSLSSLTLVVTFPETVAATFRAKYIRNKSQIQYLETYYAVELMRL